MNDIFTKIAKQNGATEEQVERAINEAIDIAFKNSRGNPEAESFWNDVLKDENTPDAKRVIQKIVDIIKSYGAC